MKSKLTTKDFGASDPITKILEDNGAKVVDATPKSTPLTKQTNKSQKKKCYCHWGYCVAETIKPCFCPCHIDGNEGCECQQTNCYCGCKLKHG